MVPKKKSKKWLYVILIIIALLFIGFGSVVMLQMSKIEKNEKQYETYLEEGEKYLLAMDYEKAETAYLKAINIEPKKPIAYVELADLYVTQEKYEDAKDILEQAKDHVEQDVENWSDDEKEAYDRIDGMLEEIKLHEKITWVVEPTIEADDIFYLAKNPNDGFSINSTSKQGENPNAVMQIGNQYGIISLDGAMLAEVEYNKVYNCGDRYHIIRTIPKYEPEFEREWDTYWLLEDGTMHADLGFGEVSGVYYYYYNGVRQKNGMSYGDLKEEIIPVQNAPEVYEDYDDACMKLNSKYAIEYNGNLLTDFVFDECGAQADGVFAVSQNGKWGYVDQNGEFIIPLEYDASWNQYPVLDQWLRSTRLRKPYCYASSEGYIPLVKDGVWEMRNSKGELVIPAGVFEAIRPVYQGKCWVKKDGKWGVIALEQKETNSEQKVETDDSWKKVYLDYIEKSRIYDDFLGEYSGEYSLIHVDDDEIPELFFDSLMVANGAELCTVHDGKLVKQHLLANGIDYVERQAKFVDPYGRMDYWLFTFYSLKDGNFQEIKKKEADLYKIVDTNEYQKKTDDFYREESEFLSGKAEDIQRMTYEQIVEAINNY